MPGAGASFRQHYVTEPSSEKIEIIADSFYNYIKCAHITMRHSKRSVQTGCGFVSSFQPTGFLLSDKLFQRRQ